MGCMKIGGRTVGATDGQSINLRACYRAKGTRARLGCDEAIPDKDMLGKVDSAFASKIIAALSAKLDATEMGRVLSILQDADLISDEEARAVGEATSDDPTSDDPSDEKVAMDAANAFLKRYPAASRINSMPGGMVDEQAARRRMAAYDAARSTALPRPSAEAVKRSQIASDSAAGFAARYPGAARIKLL